MGAERLRAWPLLAIALLWACAGAAPPPSAAPAATVSPHAQIVRALTTPERRSLVERFRERNREGGGTWVVNDEALAESVVVVDPFKGFLRRARRDRRGGAGPRASDEDAGARARAFVARNADLLGLPGSVAGALGETTTADEPKIVHFDARFPLKGYEAFPELENVVDLDVVIDASGEVVAVDNRSRIHPRLSLDVHPRLSQDDPRVVAQIVGRKVFALYTERPEAPVREEERSSSSASGKREPRSGERLPLGAIQPWDVSHVQPVIHVSPGVGLRWLTYRLAYFVEVAKLVPPGKAFYFRYVVDADTGDVIEDSRAPVVPPDGVGSAP